jgi:hypothetical protein
MNRQDLKTVVLAQVQEMIEIEMKLSMYSVITIFLFYSFKCWQLVSAD